MSTPILGRVAGPTVEVSLADLERLVDIADRPDELIVDDTGKTKWVTPDLTASEMRFLGDLRRQARERRSGR